jgi:selenide, water dikinase
MSAGRHVEFGGALASDETEQLLLADAQTSGGLLAAVTPRSAAKILAALEAAGVNAVDIGRIRAGRPRIAVQ